MTNIKLTLISFVFCFACKSQINETKKNHATQTTDSIQIENLNETDVADDFEEEHDELVSIDLFNDWKGIYELSNEYVDAWGRESLSNVRIRLNEPNDCIYESWLSSLENVEYKENSNRYKILGGMQINASHDSLSFYSSEYLIGESMNLAPVFTLIKKENRYFISSILTSPPHNGIIEMPIEKVE